MEWLLSANILRASATFPLVLSFLGRPPTRPLALAAANPAFVRSRMRSRSNSASAPIRWNISLPPGVVVSICSVKLMNSIQSFHFGCRRMHPGLLRKEVTDVNQSKIARGRVHLPVSGHSSAPVSRGWDSCLADRVGLPDSVLWFPGFPHALALQAQPRLAERAHGPLPAWSKSLG